MQYNEIHVEMFLTMTVGVSATSKSNALYHAYQGNDRQTPLIFNFRIDWDDLTITQNKGSFGER